MTSSSDTFPFVIADVVELLGLTVRRRLPSSLYLNCPFCGDQRGRLNVNTDKNVWRCNRCGAAGGMLALYARYNCTGNADAYREICEALGRYTPRPRVNDCIGVKPEQNARATPAGDTPDLLTAALHAAADTHAQGASAVTAARAD